MAAIDFGVVSGSAPLYRFPVEHLGRNAAMFLWREASWLHFAKGLRTLQIQLKGSTGGAGMTLK